MMKPDIKQWAQYYRWLEKKLGGRSGPIEQFQKRTLNTAVAILSTAQNIPFSDLTSSLYHFYAPLQENRFARMFESQQELAGADADKFAKGLHKFYNDLAAKIKASDLYDEFFWFASMSNRRRIELMGSDVHADVANGCFSMVLQALEYLRPNKFDMDHLVCGRKTSGELILIKDPFPNLDGISNEIGQAMQSGRIPQLGGVDALVKEAYSKAGYSGIESFQDAERLNQADCFFANHRATLFPFITEYTCDILPLKPFSGLALPFYSLWTAIDCEKLKELTSNGTTPLPCNGILYQFTGNLIVEEVLLKEVEYRGQTWMLYKVRSAVGEFSGYYDPKIRYLYSVFSDAKDPKIIEKIESFVLYLYAAAVSKEAAKMMETMPLCCWVSNEKWAADRVPFVPKAYAGMGGLANVYDGEQIDWVPWGQKVRMEIENRIGKWGGLSMQKVPVSQLVRPAEK